RARPRNRGRSRARGLAAAGARARRQDGARMDRVAARARARAFVPRGERRRGRARARRRDRDDVRGRARGRSGRARPGRRRARTRPNRGERRRRAAPSRRARRGRERRRRCARVGHGSAREGRLRLINPPPMWTRRWLRLASSSLVVLAIALPVLDCGARPAAAPVAPRCPDVADDAAVLAYDWTAFHVDAARAADLKRALAAAIEVKRLAARVDADLKTGCGGLATDLGASGDFESGKEACEAASRAIRETIAKLGGPKIALDAAAPKCGAPLDVFAVCAAECEARERAAPTCEAGKLQGACTGACSGACDVQSGAKCAGTCR